MRKSEGSTPELQAMHVERLKQRVARADYVIDPMAVAEALLRHTTPRHERVWAPLRITRRAQSRSDRAARRPRRA